MRILLAGIDTEIEMALDDAGFVVYAADDAAEAIDCGKLYDYDAVLLGDTDGDVLKKLRAAKVKSSIIVLSRSGHVAHIVAALDAGADDYMVSPVHADELVARIHALVRRSKGHAVSVIDTGPLSVNLSTKTATVHGAPVHLTSKEFAMLELMSLRKGSTISKDQFLNHLYGGRDEPEAKIIDVFICKLRKKLGAAGELVETVWGRGFVVRDAVAESPSLAPEIRDMMDSPPVHVSSRTVQEAEALSAAKRFGRSPSPSIVPAAGQR